MLPKMRYRLGLDLGTTSIGWCLIRLDKNDHPIAVIRMGVRIFSDGRNPKDKTSLAVARRVARQMRRRRDRLLKRKTRMLNALISFGFFPKNENLRRELIKLDPYALRKKGLYEPLSGAEFARALFHINQRRGFKSNRKTDNNDKDNSVLKKGINVLQEKLVEEGCQTLGEWLANRHANRESVRARLRGKTQKDKHYDFYVNRNMIEHEFDVLWDKQRDFNPSLFNDTAHDELKDILLYQKPLKPVKPGRCTLLPDEERAPLALPSVQRFRIYQEVNNLRILNSDLTEKPPLTVDQRNRIVSLLEMGKNATFKTNIRKLLNLPTDSHFNLEDIKRDRLKGNATSAILRKKEYFGDQWHEFSLADQDKIVDELLNQPSKSVLVEWLRKHTNIDTETAKRVAEVNLPEGYSRLSRVALSKILPKLSEEVITYSDAVVKAGFDSHSMLSHAERTGEILDELPYYGKPLCRHVAFAKDNPKNDEEIYGKIANPTVHIGLNELRKVVNTLIRRYGHPSEVVIEVTRELKLSQARKLEIQKEQKTKQNLNEQQVIEACKILGLNPEAIDRKKRRELSQRMQLWVELNPKNVIDRKCPYTGEQISVEKLLSNEVEIEHILPYSRTLDDSLANKTVSFYWANRDKSNGTPYEAFSNHSYYDYEAILERVSLMPRSKAMRFSPDGYESWKRNHKDFLARALNDTAYLSRIAKEYLSLICPYERVLAIPGHMTALLRGKYGLNTLLSTSGIKNRDDHRHHALDAAVVGITDRNLLQRFARASANAREKQLDRLVENMPLPWASYREHVKRALHNITVSHKPDHGYQGAMHEAMAWGLLGNGKVRRSEFSEESGIRQKKVENKNVIQINSTNDPNRHGLDDQGQPKAYKGYIGGSNYCIEIWCNEKDKWDGDVISTFDAYQVIRQHGETEGLKLLRHPKHSLLGKPLVMRLMINDMVKLVVDGDECMMRITTIKSNKQFFMCAHNEANVDARNKDKNDAFSYISKTPGSLQKAKGRRITVSEIGDVRDPGFRD